MKTKQSRSHRGSEPWFKGLEVKRVLIGMGAFAFGAIVTLLWPTFFPDEPERVVVVYWTHDCPCAEAWMKSLRQAGYKVRDFEQFDLMNQRRVLKTPKSLRGCHLGSYLGYFLEGHVSPQVLIRLSQQRPVARGVGYIRDSENADDHLRLFSPEGRSLPWDE